MLELNSENLLTSGKDLIHISRNFLKEKLRDTMVRNSIFAGLVFIIVANPLIFKTVGKIIKVKNPNFVLLLHSVVFSLIMYFGSLYIFDPIYKGLIVEGMDPSESTPPSSLCPPPGEEVCPNNLNELIAMNADPKSDYSKHCCNHPCLPRSLHSDRDRDEPLCSDGR